MDLSSIRDPLALLALLLLVLSDVWVLGTRGIVVGLDFISIMNVQPCPGYSRLSRLATLAEVEVPSAAHQDPYPVQAC